VEEVNQGGNKQDPSADSDYAGKHAHYQTEQNEEKGHGRNDNETAFCQPRTSG
jgi:hypothetical protein